MTSAPPWVVPVTLVAGDPAVLVQAEVRTVRLDAPLGDVDAVRVTTGVLDGRRVLAGIEPVRTTMDPTATSVTDGSLEAVLRSLGRPVPVLAVGTELQRRVLAALAAVPAGEVVTYGALAGRAGAPGAARAAARVMSTNRVPLVLPCHRVVPAGGGLGAYGWGTGVKAALLAQEGVDVPRPGPRTGAGAARAGRRAA